MSEKMKLFIPDEYVHTIDSHLRLDDQWTGVASVTYKLNIFQKIFVAFEYTQSCYAALFISVIMSFAIVLNIVIYILGSTDQYSYAPSTCLNPGCDNDPILCPGRQICPPQPIDVFYLIDDICIFFFTVDYFTKLFLCWTVSPRLAGLTQDALAKMPFWKQIALYFFRLPNIVDLCATLPFYILLIKYNRVVHQTSGFVRVLRIPRLLKLLNISKTLSSMNVIVEILKMTLQKSWKALSFTFFFVGLGTILSATIVFLLEQGSFTVDSAYPEGAYLIDSATRDGKQQSVYTSIPVTMYYVIVTLTTLGYGDLAPLSDGGRAVACLLCFSGIIVLALPIAVIGGNFVDLYNLYTFKMDHVMMKTDVERTRETVRKAPEINNEMALLDKMRLCVKHEKFCVGLAHMAEMITIKSGLQGEVLKKAYLDLYVVLEDMKLELREIASGQNDKSPNARLSDAADATRLENLRPLAELDGGNGSINRATGHAQSDYIPPKTIAEDMARIGNDEMKTASGGVDGNDGSPLASGDGALPIVEVEDCEGLAVKVAPTWPWFVPHKFVYTKPGNDVDLYFPERIYMLNWAGRIFLLFQNPNSCKVAYAYFVSISLVILLGVTSIVLSSEKTFMSTPSTCQNPACDNDLALCPGIQVCEPQSFPVFDAIDRAVVIVFSIDYAIRFFLCGTVPRRLADVMSDDWDDEEVRNAKKEGRLPLSDPEPLSAPYQMLLYFFQLQNLIDLIAILPFYIQLGNEDDIPLSFFRIVRLTRILRIVRFAGQSDYTKLLTATIKRSIPVLIPLSFVVAVVILLFGCIIMLAEGGTFTVTAAYPKGAWLRPGRGGIGVEVSPFVDIAMSLYFVVITTTTVGYGDLYPTTTGGHTLACIFAYAGVLIWTFPIAIIGKNFVDEYKKMIDRDAEIAEKAQMEAKLMHRNTQFTRFAEHLHTIGEVVKIMKMAIDEAEDIKASAQTLHKDGHQAAETAEVLRHAVAPPQDWLENF